MEDNKMNISNSTEFETTYMGVCDSPVCDFHTDCKTLEEIQSLCDDHKSSHPGHDAFPVKC